MKEIVKLKKYFNQISRKIEEICGKPYFFSARDVVLLRELFERNIPSRVINEGIDFAWEKFSIAKKRKRFSFFASKKFIYKAYERYREKRVGLSKGNPLKKIILIEQEVINFLKINSVEVEYLKKYYKKVLEDLEYVKQNIKTVECLDSVDSKIEEEILKRITEEKKQEIIKILRKKYGKNVFMNDNMKRIGVLKYIRNKYRIPYVSSFLH
ncbi:MAG: hypothetical protein AB1410_06540 [Acidobacteriota bacterium]